MLFSFAGARNAHAITTIAGTFWGNEYLLMASPVNVTANAVLKITFETTIAGNNLSLGAGTMSDFVAARCATKLNESGGPGYAFLTIVDAASPNGKQIYVIRNIGINGVSFHLTME